GCSESKDEGDNTTEEDTWSLSTSTPSLTWTEQVAPCPPSPKHAKRGLKKKKGRLFSSQPRDDPALRRTPLEKPPPAAAGIVGTAAAGRAEVGAGVGLGPAGRARAPGPAQPRQARVGRLGMRRSLRIIAATSVSASPGSSSSSSSSSKPNPSVNGARYPSLGGAKPSATPEACQAGRAAITATPKGRLVRLHPPAPTPADNPSSNNATGVQQAAPPRPVGCREQAGEGARARAAKKVLDLGAGVRRPAA
ncbi:unnamed protein product, partial [Discosporangium mesarthrocarpum]